MSHSLAGKQLVISGGTRGIGAAITTAAALSGAKSIVIGYQSNVQAAQELMQKLKSNKDTSSTEIFAVQSTLKDEGSCAKFIDAAVGHLEGKKIDGLVLSAGVLSMVTLAQSTDENFDYHFDTNVKGTLFAIKAALPYIANGGRIVCFSTSVLATPQALGPGYVQYAMAKAAVEQMVKTLQRDPSIGGPDRRIGINAVAPGATGTDLFYHGKSEEVLKRIASIMPSNRIGKPEEIAQPTIFLLTPASSWIQGQILRVNGAQTL